MCLQTQIVKLPYGLMVRPTTACYDIPQYLFLISARL